MTGRGLLLAELEKVCRSCCRIGRLIEPQDIDFRPNPGMRSIAELGSLMAGVPLVDLKLLKGASQDEVRELEDALQSDSPDAWCDALRDGYEQVRRYMEQLSFDQYENGSGTAYYGRTQTHAAWLLEIVTHLHHQRAQFLTYLKLMNYEVDPRLLQG